MRRFIAVFLVATCVAGIAATKARAQIGITHQTVEWLTASSDVVVIATVDDLHFKDRPLQLGERQSSWQDVTVTLKVQSTLKGTAPQTVDFVVAQWRGAEALPKWKESGHAVLWFLVKELDAREEHVRLRLRDRQPAFVNVSAIELGSARADKRVSRPVFSMDFSVLTNRATIVAATKAEVARQGEGRARSVQIMISHEVAQRSGRVGDANAMLLPVNARLELLAREWIDATDNWMRRAGVKCLSEFKSKRNATLLKGLMDDETWWIEHTGDDDKNAQRVYYIREAAYKTLQKWGVMVPKPVLREPHERKADR